MLKILFDFEEFIRFGGAGAVGAFRNDANAARHLLDGLCIDLAFDRGRDQHIGFLGDPGIAIFDHITGFFCGFLINRAVLVHDGQQEARIDSLLVAVGVGLLVVAIPAGDACDLAAQHVP